MKQQSLDFLTQRKAVILADLKFKTQAEDWHGVADCAMDLREVEARMEMLPDLRSNVSVANELYQIEHDEILKIGEQEARRRAVAPTV